MNVTNGYEYYPMAGNAMERFRFTKTTAMSAKAPWEDGPQSVYMVDEKTPVNGAWKFAYRRVKSQSSLNVITPALDTTTGQTEEPWSFIYNVTLNDNRDGWVEPASITTSIGEIGDDPPQTDPTKPQTIVTFAIIGICLYLLSKLSKWGRK